METTRPSEPAEVTAVTGNPLADYERYVDMLSNVLANGLALSTDREFLESLDRTLPLHEAVRNVARESIRWRFAFDIDEIRRKEFDRVQRFAEMAAANFDSELDYDGAEIKRRILIDAHNIDPEHPGAGEPCAICSDDDRIDGQEEDE